MDWQQTTIQQLHKPEAETALHSFQIEPTVKLTTIKHKILLIFYSCVL